MELFFALCDQKNLKISSVLILLDNYFTVPCILLSQASQMNCHSISYYHTEIQFEDQVRH